MKEIALITGSTGFVGSHLTRRLFSSGFNVHCLVRKDSDLSRIADIKKHLTIHKVDLGNEKSLFNLIQKIKPDYIFHTAAVGIHAGFEEEASVVVTTNLLGTINLVKACEKTHYKLFINTGTSSEYGPKKSPMNEKDSCSPESIYAISKLAATRFCELYAKTKNKPVVTLRIFSPYGPMDNDTRFVADAISRISDGKSLTIENPEGVRDFIYIDDLIDAYMKCLPNRKKIVGEIINIGSGQQSSVSQVIKTLEKLTPVKSKILIKKRIRKYESSYWEADIEKAKKLLSWIPKTSLDDGLRKIFQYRFVK